MSLSNRSEIALSFAVHTRSAIFPNFGKYCSRRRLLHPEVVDLTIARNVGNYVSFHCLSVTLKCRQILPVDTV